MELDQKYLKKLELLRSFLFPITNMAPKQIIVLDCQNFLQKLFGLKKPLFDFVEKYFGCTFSSLDLTDVSFRCIPESESCYLILAHPDENTPFTPLIDYLNTHENMVEIFWIVLDKLNKQTLDIFQGRTRTNVKFINSADFRKEFEKNMECHRWGGIGADLPELPLLPINQGRFIYAKKTACTVSLIDGRTGQLVSVLFNGRLTDGSYNGKYSCHLVGVGWDRVTNCLMIMVNWISSKKKRMGLFFIDIEQKELKKYYSGGKNIPYPWEPVNFSLSGTVIMPLTSDSIADDGRLFSIQSKFNYTALYLDEELMTIEIVLDYFKPITSHQPGAVLSVHEIATGSLITESQSNTGALVAMSIQKNLMGLVYNNNIKNFQVELRLLQDINNDVGRMGSEIFKNRHSIARHIFLGNDFLLVVKQSYGKDSFLIVSLKNLSLYAKIKLPARASLGTCYYHPEFPELFICQVIISDTIIQSFVYCFDITERSTLWSYPLTSYFNPPKKVYLKSCM